MDTPPPAVPPTPAPAAPPTDDAGHLRLLAIFHYIMAGLSLIGACVGVFYIVMGIAFLAGGLPDDEPGAEFVGPMIVVVGAIALVISAAIAILQFMVAKSLTNRTRRTFCIVIAALECLSVPLGTILGIFTIVVLLRPSVTAMFAANEPGSTPR